MTALSFSAPVSLYHLHIQDVLDTTQKVTYLSSNMDAPLVGSISDYFNGVGLLFKGDLKGTRPPIELSLSTAERIRHRYRTALAAASLGGLSFFEGDFDDAKKHKDLALSLAPQEPVVLLFAIIQETMLGDFATSNAHIDRQLETANLTRPGPNLEHAMPAFCIPWAARMSGNLSQLQSAKKLAHVVFDSDNVTSFVELFARSGLAATAVITRNESEAAEQYPAIVEMKKLISFAFFSVDRLLGLLAHTMGKLDDSQKHFEGAIAICREAGNVTELAWSLCDYADMLLERDEPGDREKAVPMLDESLQISSDLGVDLRSGP
jgi:tetratricopeptide (TPR) repeat protein